MWVADMDFKAPPAVIESLRRHVDHGIYGYTVPPDDLMGAVVDKLAGTHGWDVKPEWIVCCRGSSPPEHHLPCRGIER